MDFHALSLLHFPLLHFPLPHFPLPHFQCPRSPLTATGTNTDQDLVDAFPRYATSDTLALSNRRLLRSGHKVTERRRLQTVERNLCSNCRLHTDAFFILRKVWMTTTGRHFITTPAPEIWSKTVFQKRTIYKLSLDIRHCDMRHLLRHYSRSRFE